MMALFRFRWRTARIVLAALPLVLPLLLLWTVATPSVGAQGSSAAAPASAHGPPLAFTDEQQENTRRFLMAFAGPDSPLHSVWGSGDFCDWPFVTCTARGVHIRGARIRHFASRPVVPLPEVPASVNASEVLLVELSSSSWLPLGWSFGGTLPVSWSQLSHLRDVDVDSEALRGTLPPEWGHMHYLESLMLSHASSGAERGTLSGTLPAEWAGMLSLRTLRLDGNAISGTLPREWGALQRLESIWLHDNNLTGTVPFEWLEMPALDDLRLGGNQLANGVSFE